MTLSAGTRLGPYEIVGSLGAGGMGEVYRARDARLNRDVAIKVLPDLFAHDPDRLGRFAREAQVLASLNHQNIAHLYGLEESGGIRALVMELVEGRTLADRIAQGPIPLDDALPIARQIIEALETAHEQGIVHRDLKPANIKLRPDGVVKVLDFGLAKALDPAAVSSVDAMNSPTMTARATQLGMIFGTAAYMAPEQAKGRTVDRRADIWAFGCVLFEMLTGTRAFRGDDVQEVFLAIMRDEPAWARLPAGLSPAVGTYIKRCLQKDARQRVQAIGDVRLALEGAFETVAPTPNSPESASSSGGQRTWIAAFAATAVLAAALSAYTVSLYRRVTPAPVVRFIVPPPENGSFDPASTGSAAAVVPEISPDGRKLAFTARDAAGKMMLWVRPLDVLSVQPLAGTEDAVLPFWSPDSQTLGFFAQGKLKRIDAVGGPVQTICEALNGRGGTWNGEGTIVFANRGRSQLFRVAAAGGQSVKMPIMPEVAEARVPSFLPDGRHFLYLAVPGGTYVGSLDGGEAKSVVPSDARAVYSAGHILFVRQGTLLAQTFDVKRLATVGEPVPVAERVANNPVGDSLRATSGQAAGVSGLAAFSASETGTLAYRTGGAESTVQLTWVDRAGKPIATVGPAGAYRGTNVSPDGTRVAVHRHDGNGGDIWLIDERGVASRFTFDASQENASPVWSRDGRRIVYTSQRGQDVGLYVKPVDGAPDEELLLKGDNAGSPLLRRVPTSWSPDGKYILYSEASRIWVLPLQGARKPFGLVSSDLVQSEGQISPDGRWVAYRSNESGRQEIYVRPFLTGTGKWQISTNGGTSPRWSADGKDVFFLSGPSTQTSVASVSINAAGSTLHPGAPAELFVAGEARFGHDTNYELFSISPDGKRFLIPRPVNAAENNSPITVVVNWPAGVKK